MGRISIIWRWLAIVLGGSWAIASCQPTSPVAPSSSAPLSAESAPESPVEAAILQPNVWLTVEAEAGSCPDAVGLWAFMLPLEGGADHTVVVDLAPIAQLPVQRQQPAPQHLIYTAPLRDEFATCVGTAHSDDLVMYWVRFDQAQVQFELDLTAMNGFHEIRYADISVNRPYVYWRAAE